MPVADWRPAPRSRNGSTSHAATRAHADVRPDLVPREPRTSCTRPSRMRTSGMPIFMRFGVAVAAGSMLLAGLSGCSGGDARSASCAASIVYDGHTYWGRGDVKRDPEVTGRSMPAELPGCGDSGGQSEPEPDEAVRGSHPPSSSRGSPSRGYRSVGISLGERRTGIKAPPLDINDPRAQWRVSAADATTASRETRPSLPPKVTRSCTRLTNAAFWEHESCCPARVSASASCGACCSA